MKGLKALFQLRGTYIGIAAAVLFQLIFFSVWLTAYKGVQDRTENLSIGIVNEDQKDGVPLVTKLEQHLPFQVKQYTSFDKAYEAMNGRKVAMIIQIPPGFSSSLKAGERPAIYYWINQANATTSKTIMEQVANQVTNQVNEQARSVQKAAAVSILEQKLQAFPLEPPMAQGIGDAIESTLTSIHSQPIKKVIKKPNHVDDFSANLVPLMVIISSFVGAMVMVMQIHEAATTIQSYHSKWILFLGRQVINLGVSFLLPLLTIGLMKLFNIPSQEPLHIVYLFQGVLFLSFLLFAQVFVYLLGNYGMVFNILALSLQLVTSGVLVAKELLTTGYQQLATFLPATYGAMGYYSIIFGGNSGMLMDYVKSLLLIAGFFLLLVVGSLFIPWRITKVKVQPSKGS